MQIQFLPCNKYLLISAVYCTCCQRSFGKGKMLGEKSVHMDWWQNHRITQNHRMQKQCFFSNQLFRDPSPCCFSFILSSNHKLQCLTLRAMFPRHKMRQDLKSFYNLQQAALRRHLVSSNSILLSYFSSGLQAFLARWEVWQRFFLPQYNWGLFYFGGGCGGVGERSGGRQELLRHERASRDT